jgi:hypothetical protein
LAWREILKREGTDSPPTVNKNLGGTRIYISRAPNFVGLGDRRLGDRRQKTEDRAKGLRADHVLRRYRAALRGEILPFVFCLQVFCLSGGFEDFEVAFGVVVGFGTEWPASLNDGQAGKAGECGLAVVEGAEFGGSEFEGEGNVKGVQHAAEGSGGMVCG